MKNDEFCCLEEIMSEINSMKVLKVPELFQIFSSAKKSNKNQIFSSKITDEFSLLNNKILALPYTEPSSDLSQRESKDPIFAIYLLLKGQMIFLAHNKEKIIKQPGSYVMPSNVLYYSTNCYNMA